MVNNAMSVFTPITETQLKTLLSGYQIGDLLSYQGIEGGTDNSNFFVSTDQGEYVLTLFENLSADQLPFFLQLGQHLAKHGCKIAAPICDSQDKVLQQLADKPAVLFQRLPGRHLAIPDRTACSEMGVALADIHNALESFNVERANPFGLRWLQQQNPAQLWLDEQDQQLFIDTLLDLNQLNEMDLPTGVIHADLFHDNALFDDGHLAGIIDWYFASTDYLLLDLAIMINDWCRHGLSFDANKVTAMVSAYQSHRAMSRLELEALPLMRQLAACRFWVSRQLAWLELGDQQRSEITVKSPNDMRNLLRSLRQC
jgi:homoserine kinase type II